MKNIFCIGIGGVGMSALALYLNQAGFFVSGSDIADFRLRKTLEAKGITVFLNHKEENIDGADFLIYSTAIPIDNPEYKRALLNNIPSIDRLEALKRIFARHKIVSITGSYGKSTTTAFTAALLNECQFSPSWLIGADLFSFPPAKYNESEWAVIETDESKPVFLNFDPYSVILTNIGKDHLPNYDNSQQNLKNELKKFILRRNKQTKAILCGDDSDSLSVVSGMNPDTDFLLCGLGENNHYQITNCKTIWNLNSFQTHFTLHFPDRQCARCIIPMPGEKNAIDAVMAFAMCEQLGVNREICLQGLPKLPTMDRRFEIRLTTSKAILIDDEGDSPEVIENVLKNCKTWFPNNKLIAVLQPHRFSRLKSLFEDYVEIMTLADEVIILPVYSAGEECISGVDSQKLMTAIDSKSFSKKKIQVLSMEEAVSYLKPNLLEQCTIITLGPGDVWKVADELAKKT